MPALGVDARRHNNIIVWSIHLHWQLDSSLRGNGAAISVRNIAHTITVTYEYTSNLSGYMM